MRALPHSSHERHLSGEQSEPPPDGNGSGHAGHLSKFIAEKRPLKMCFLAPELYSGDLRHNPDAIKLFTDHALGGDGKGYRYWLLATSTGPACRGGGASTSRHWCWPATTIRWCR